jgi:hypothetical protein
MRASTIQPVLERLSVNIPLEVDVAKIPAWLEALDPEETGQSCGKVLRLLKSLPMEEMSAKVKLETLGNIRSTLDRLAAKLEKPLADAGSPLPAAERNDAELVICGYAELAQKLWQTIEQAGFPQEHKKPVKSFVGAFFQGLESLRQALLHIALLYDRPYEGFWRLCYQFYRRAELLNILDTGIEGDETGSVCIANSFKNLLVFYLSDTGLLTQKEMKALYNLFNNRPVPAKVYTELREDKEDLLSGFDLLGDLPPAPLRRMDVRDGEMRYFSTMKIARSAYRYLKGKNAKQVGMESGNYALFVKIAKVLGMQETRQYSRVTEKRSCRGLIGFNKTLKFLTHKNSASLAGAVKILPPELSKASGDWTIPDLKLVPLGEEDLHRVQTSKNLGAIRNEKMKKLFSDSGATQPNASVEAQEAALFDNIEILDSSAKDYGILLKNPKTPVKIGELIGVVSDLDGRIEVGLVRRIAAAGKQEAELGVELISTQADLGCIGRPADVQNTQLVLLLPGIAALKQKDSIVFPSHAFAAGETVFLQHGANKVFCRLDKLLHATSVFSHAELAVAEIQSGHRRHESL